MSVGKVVAMRLPWTRLLRAEHLSRTDSVWNFYFICFSKLDKIELYDIEVFLHWPNAGGSPSNERFHTQTD